MLNRVITRMGVLLVFFPVFLVSCKKDIDFSKMSENEQMEFYQRTVEAVYEKGDVLFKECRTATEFGNHLEDIRLIKGVEDVYADGNAVYVELVGGKTISYLYTPTPSITNDEVEQLMIGKATAPTRTGDYPSSWMISNRGYYKNACIVNQQSRDEGRDYIPQFIIPNVKNALENIGIHVEVELTPTRDFLLNDMCQYDIVFLISHGSYNSKKGRHWIFTAEKAENSNSEDIGRVWEVHDGDSVIVSYYKISDSQIASSKTRFQNEDHALIFNVSCESLMGNDNLWEAFQSRGVGFYLGYDRTNGAGQMAGMYYFGRLASGMSFLNAYHDLPFWCKKDPHEKKDSLGNVIIDYYAWLRCRYDIDSNISSTCITSPSVSGWKDVSTGKDSAVELVGTAPLYAPSFFTYDNSDKQECQIWQYEFSADLFRYGLCISESPSINESRLLDPMRVGDDSCRYDDYQVVFSNKVEDLEPDKQYYYWSYLYDGHDYVFSDMESFTTRRINRFIPDDIIDQMDDYIPIYEGNNPPNVEGQYLLSPSELVYDSTHGFSIGHIFDDLYFQFLNQDMENNTLDYVEEQGNSSQVGTGAFISGEGDRFSVFFNTDGNAVYDDYSFWYKTALVISGIKTADGIKDLDYAFVLVDKGDDPKPYYIPSGSFRVFKDGDGLSTNTNYFSRRTSAPLKPMTYNPKPLPSMLEVEPN